MVIVFDLDDTVYEEKTFLHSGFENVARYLSAKKKVPPEQILSEIHNIHKIYGRDRVFNRVLKKLNIPMKNELLKCISIYRYSQRKIKPYSDFLKCFAKSNYKTYLVTDGNPKVQRHKINLLNVGSLFLKTFCTRQYGLSYEKPSLKCFEKILKIENCEYQDLVYVGDNVLKDFVNLNTKGAHTIRLHRGNYKNTIKEKSFHAMYTFDNHKDIFDKISSL